MSSMGFGTCLTTRLHVEGVPLHCASPCLSLHIHMACCLDVNKCTVTKQGSGAVLCQSMCVCVHASMRCKYGVITSQLHRYKVACSGVREFLRPAVKLCADYVKKGYAWNRIKYYFQRFTRNHMHGMRPSAITDRYCRQFGRPAPRVVQ